MIQDIFPHVLKNEYKKVKPGSESRAIFFRNGEILMKGLSPADADFPWWIDVEEAGVSMKNLVYIFSVDGTDFFLYLGKIFPAVAVSDECVTRDEGLSGPDVENKCDKVVTSCDQAEKTGQFEDVFCHSGKEGQDKTVSVRAENNILHRIMEKHKDSAEIEGKKSENVYCDESCETPGPGSAEVAESLGSPYAFHKIRSLSASRHRYTMFAAITAHHIYSWYRSNRFCGSCGKPMKHDEKERMLKCDCGNMVYPRISPAIIAAVINKDKILLTKYADRDYKKYALIAGFAEVGESIEECLRREIREEVGLEVTNIRYYKSQPWAFSQSLLMGFFCDVDGSDKVTLDHRELAVAEWVSRQDLKVELDGVSLTNEMMVMFKEGEIV